LILWKIIELVAARCHILRLKCTKFDFDWGSAPDPAKKTYSAPLGPLTGFKGTYFEEEVKWKKRRERGDKGGEGRKGREYDGTPPKVGSHLPCPKS